MVKEHPNNAGSHLSRLLALACLMALTSGCATRALMSSDRYEKPKPETQQYRSSEKMSQSWQSIKYKLSSSSIKGS